MKILLSNDDGVHAPGLMALRKALEADSDLEVYTVAPLEERSTTGHTLSLTSPLRLVEIEKNVFGCSGYPADCVLMGIGHLLKEKNIRPDLIVSGINKGSNLGQDTYYSGTAAAAREAVFHGIPGIAVSTTTNIGRYSKKFDMYDPAAEFIRDLVQKEIHKKIDPMGLININVPNLLRKEIKGWEVTNLGFRQYSEEIEERNDFRERPYYWIKGDYLGHSEEAGTDCHALENSKISFTYLNLLHTPTDNSGQWQEFLEGLESWP